MLSSIFPLAFIKATIGPKHLPIALFFILNKVAFIKVTARKVKLSVALFQSFTITTIIFSLSLLPFSLAMPQSIPKVSLVKCTFRLPLISTSAIKSTILVLASVNVSINKILFACSMFEPIDESSCIGWLFSFQCTLSMHDSQFPYPFVNIALIIDKKYRWLHAASCWSSSSSWRIGGQKAGNNPSFVSEASDLA